MNTPLIVANWKSNKNVAEARAWAEAFKSNRQRENATYVVCPPYSLLASLAEYAQAGFFSLGVQDISPFGAGAYTGEVSGANLVDFGVKYSIVGHSERRKYLGENSELIAKKVVAAVDADITPILCVDRDQFAEQANALDGSVRAKIIVAYEPVHAISTFGGQEDPIETTLQAIQEAKNHFGDVPILYGGSVHAENSLAYLDNPHIQGVLVGGASLDAVVFAKL